MGTFGVKAGPQLGAGVWLYGFAGVSVLNETLNINLARNRRGSPAARSASAAPGRRILAHLVARREFQHASRFAGLQLHVPPTG